MIILQACLGENEFQDVATIEIEATDDETSMQIHGNEDIYGENYYVVPVYAQINTWPIITCMYGPAYRPYWSKYQYRFYPRWWKARPPIARYMYLHRTAIYTKRAGFKFTKAGNVVVTKIVYKPRSSPLVKRTVIRTPTGTRVITKRPGEKPVVKKRPNKR